MKILLVDDDPLVTSGLQTIIEIASREDADPMKIVDIGQNGQEAINLFQQTRPDLILMDIRMPLMNGIEAGEQILKLDNQAKIIFLTTFQEDDYIVKALKIGAQGYLLKTNYQSLVPALRAVQEGQSVFGREIMAKVPDFISREADKADLEQSTLNAKEQELLYQVAQGLNNKEIAEVMHFSEGTVRNYISQLLEKLDLRDRTQLAIYYYKQSK
ncbi:response regulator transcription factor [Ignavigranum ruoffiae]|uniref:response regulator transcription factor n=1 Tax=Ignavigranum ruoffiae TaxID=89093 RepID=UPI0031F72576